MHFEAKPSRDEFTFSLQGMATVNSFAFPPAISQQGINREWDARLGASRERGEAGLRADLARRLERFLARYFAPGACCCDSR